MNWVVRLKLLLWRRFQLLTLVGIKKLAISRKNRYILQREERRKREKRRDFIESYKVTRLSAQFSWKMERMERGGREQTG